MRKISVLAVAAALGLAACGSSQTKTVTATPRASATAAAATTSSSTASTSQAMTRAQAGKLYLQDAAPVNAALKTLSSEVTSSTPIAEGQKDAKPVVSAFQTADEKLLDLAQQYPPAATDIKALVTADSAVIADLQDVAAPTDQQGDQDLAKDGAAVNIVRADLGLPQRKNG